VRRQLIEELETRNRELLEEANQQRPDHQRLFDIDQQFHQAYVNAGGGPRLRALHAAVKPQTERYIRLYVSALVDEIDKSVAEHARVLDAIREGDGPAAESAVEQNWQNAVDRLCSVIDSLGERGSW
jgi:DNA-binding GntR family transcriptional regulator